ncbi:LysR family transcriptional regulator [Nocardia gamkensis]|uniref:LysR family transcriptional regulator n=1 Tax=Nocardia gamkensis TaxID=352869 RepID=A0A7X6R1A9_9NOCA|nr:LysR substrate-binding domain-containing protein [Nocardia gamkensis]NKY25031.1 LysR family transcriptional regulator [Nocardia gamkensis]NQE66819.1 SDS degradation transcriptional activation protein [Nocardia gamkensis]
MDQLRQLRYFVAVAEELHFGRAAERLGIAQPPLSQRIRRLETDLGARLFDRGSRRVELTEAGQILLAESRDLLARWERTKTLVGKAHRGEMDAVRIGVPPELAGRVLAALLTAFEARDVRVDLQELTTAEQVRLLADRQLDAGLLQHPVDVVGLELGPVVETPLGVVLPRDSPLAARSALELADLAGHGLVIFPRAAAPGLYDATLRRCWEQGFRPASVQHARNPEFVLGMVLSGRGVAFDQGMVARKEPRVVWRPLPEGALSHRLSLAWPVGVAHPLVGELAELVVTVLQGDGASRPGTVADPPQRPWNVVYGSP